MTSTTGPSRANSQVLLLIGVDALFGFAIGLSTPSVAPLVFALGVTLTFFSQAQTVGGLGSTFLRLPVGVLMDRIGRKPFIMIDWMHYFIAVITDPSIRSGNLPADATFLSA